LIEELKKPLYELKSETQRISETWAKEATYKAQANKVQIESLSKINIAKNNKDLQNLKNTFEMEMDKLEHTIKIEYDKEKNQIELHEKQILSDLETSKFEKVIKAIWQDTLVEISKAWPESQIKMLQALGLDWYILTNWNSPVNLFNFANSIAKK